MNKHFFLFILFVLTTYFVNAQTISSDDLFKNARHAAFINKNYDKAKELAYQALSISPAYSDIDIFLGRIYSWNKQYDSAKYRFTKVLEAKPANEDASMAYADLEYWNDHYEASLNICDDALSHFPQSEELLLKKARALNALKKYKDANAANDLVLKINKYNEGAIALRSTIRDELAKNNISLTYENSSFDKQYAQSWNFASFSYGRQTSFGSVIGRLNYANRFGSNGLQGEVDAYPHISKTFYGYLNFGYSGNTGVFPSYRAGFSLYANLPKSFEAELGMRYLLFATETEIYTASIGKYYKNFLFSARTYLTPSSTSLSQSYIASARYYLKGKENYVGIDLGSGISPDDNSQSVQFNNKLPMLSSRKISAEFNHTFLKWNTISIGAGLFNQEYEPGIKGNQYNISLGLTRRF